MPEKRAPLPPGGHGSTLPKAGILSRRAQPREPHIAVHHRAWLDRRGKSSSTLAPRPFDGAAAGTWATPRSRAPGVRPPPVVERVRRPRDLSSPGGTRKEKGPRQGRRFDWQPLRHSPCWPRADKPALKAWRVNLRPAPRAGCWPAEGGPHHGVVLFSREEKWNLFISGAHPGYIPWTGAGQHRQARGQPPPAAAHGRGPRAAGPPPGRSHA